MQDKISTLLEEEHHQIDAGIAAFLDTEGTAELTRATQALRRHIYLEEEFLFPPLRAAGMLPPVLVMLREHGEIWRSLDAVDALRAAGDETGARERCRELMTQLEGHNAKEEPIIYPQGDAVLGEDATEDLLGFIESGRLPEGWVCAQA